LSDNAHGPGEYDLRSTAELVDLMNRQDTTVPAVVRSAAPAIERAVDAVVERLRDGGRLVYVGAGSSGRLAELDAFECVATFGVDEGEVVALVAGGLGASPLAAAAVEDDRDAGAADLASASPTTADVVIGVSASGRTPYVMGAIEAARAAGALTIVLVCVRDSELAELADQAIEVAVGPELLSGSTRLKAGTAQKIALNALSSLLMIRLGKVYAGLMVDVRATNEKLLQRAERILHRLTGCDGSDARDALKLAGGNLKIAALVLKGYERNEAERLLIECGHDLRKAFADLPPRREP
jgi:N-acetylmuramic acid 6-phosphate etherase